MSSAEYVELRAHSWYSFLNGASSVGELLARTAELELPALGVTDVNNLCGALEFARAATALGIQPSSGADLLLDEGGDPAPVSLLAESGTGYANLSRLLSLARLVDGREWAESEATLRRYLDWFSGGSVYLELQQHLVQGDTARIRRLGELAERCGVEAVATNGAWYHRRGRARLHDALTAIRHSQALSEVQRLLKTNHQYWLKSRENCGPCSGRRRKPYGILSPSRNDVQTSTCRTTWPTVTAFPTARYPMDTTPKAGLRSCAGRRRAGATTGSTGGFGIGWTRSLR